MSVHQSILELLIALGYPRQDGGCNGFSIKWLESNFLDEAGKKEFADRINLIVKRGKKLVEDIEQVKKKKGINLSEDDRKLLDTAAFIESLIIYQSPEIISGIVDTSNINQFSIDLISHIASSNEILNKGGLTCLFSEAGIYNKQETADYLSDLWTVIDKSNFPPNQPIGIVLANNNHTIALMYSPSGWTFMDINQYPPEDFYLNEYLPLATVIKKAFTVPECKIFFMSTPSRETQYKDSDMNHVYLYKTGDKYFYLRKKNGKSVTYFIPHKKIQSEKDKSILNSLNRQKFDQQSDKLKNSRDRYLIDMILDITEKRKHTIPRNQPEIFQEFNTAVITTNNDFASREILTANLQNFKNSHILTKEHAQRSNMTHVNLAHIASFHNDCAVMKKLESVNMNFNKTMYNGFAPIHIAAFLGHTDLAEFLVQIPDIDLNLQDNNGVTAIQLAVENGRRKVVELLAKYVDIHQTTFAGLSLLHLAVLFNQPEMIELFTTLGLDTRNTTQGGFSLIHLAAIKNYPSLIKLLHELDVDVNAVADKGATPFFVAAQNGCTEALEELIRCNADTNIPFTDSEENLKRFAETMGKDVSNRMDKLLKRRKPVNAKLSITPYEIAWVMGHDIKTPLHVAIQLGKWQSIHNMDIKPSYSKNELLSEDFDGKTLLQYAFETNNTTLLKNILSGNDFGLDVITINDQSGKYFSECLIDKKNTEFMAILSTKSFFKQLVMFLLAYQIQALEYEKNNTSKFKSFIGSLTGIDFYTQISAAKKMIKALHAENPEVESRTTSIDFTHDELVALKNDKLGIIISLLGETNLPKAYIQSVKTDSYNLMKRF